MGWEVCIVVGTICVAGCGRIGFFDEPAADAPTKATSNVVTFGDQGDDIPTAMIATSDGNLIIGGQYRGTVNFGCPALTSVGGADGMMFELTPTLSCVNTWTIGSSGDDLVTTMAQDVAGNLVVTGEFRTTATMSTGPSLTAQFTRDVFLTKLSPAWTNVWTQQLPGNSNDETYDIIDRIATDSQGDVHMFARIWGNNVVYGWGGVTQTFTDAGWGDDLVVHITADGSYVGADMFGGGGSEEPYGLVIDAQDNAYYGGLYRGTADFDPGPAVLDESGNFDGFVFRRGPDNSLQWADVEQNGAWRPYEWLTLTPAGQLAAIQNDLFTLMPAEIVRTEVRDTSDGTIVWSHDLPAMSIYSLALASDPDSNLYVGGWFSGAVDFDPDGGGDIRTAVGGNDCFLQRYNADGTLAWTETFGGSGDDQIDGIVALGDNDVVVTGQFQNSIDFGTPDVPEVRTSAGGYDIFVDHLTR